MSHALGATKLLGLEYCCENQGFSTKILMPENERFPIAVIYSTAKAEGERRYDINCTSAAIA